MIFFGIRQIMKLDKIFSAFKFARLVRRSDSLQSHGGDESPVFPSLDMAFDLTRELLAAQMERIDGLDAKANLALVSATAVVSAALLLQALLLPSHSYSVCSVLIPGFVHALPLLVKRALPVLPLLITYLGVVITASYAYRVRDYQQVPTPRTLLDKYIDKPVDHTKALLFRAMVEAYEANEFEIKKKVVWIDYALLILVLETGLLVLLLLFQVVC